MAKLTPRLTPSVAATSDYAQVYKLETTTRLRGGETVFDGSDEPTFAHSNAQAIQIVDNLFLLSRRSGPVRNAVLSAATDGSANPDYLSCTTTTVTVLGATEPVVLSFADGFGRIGAVDHVAVIDTNETFSAASILPGSNGLYPVFAVLNMSTGAVSFSFGVQHPLNAVTPWEISRTPPTLVGGNVPDRYWYDPQKHQAWRTAGSPGSVTWMRVRAVWLGWVELDTNLLLVGTESSASFSATDHQGVPAGTVVAYAASTPPAGWLVCNGTAASRTANARLFGVIGTTFGAGDGSTTFNLPDLRGQFLRGFDAGRGLDPGRVFGSDQADAFESHTHTEYSWNASGSTALGGAGSNFGTAQTSATGGTETRPTNVAMLYIIKT